MRVQRNIYFAVTTAIAVQLGMATASVAGVCAPTLLETTQNRCEAASDLRSVAYWCVRAGQEAAVCAAEATGKLHWMILRSKAQVYELSAIAYLSFNKVAQARSYYEVALTSANSVLAAKAASGEDKQLSAKVLADIKPMEQLWH